MNADTAKVLEDSLVLHLLFRVVEMITNKLFSYTRIIKLACIRNTVCSLTMSVACQQSQNLAVVVIEACAVLLFVGVTTGSEMLHKRLT